jgi:RNA polymerase sigma-70 factor (ECF subfamily)
VTSEEEFRALIEGYDAAARRIARVYAGADGEADDLYQEILLQLWRSFPSFSGQSKPGTWLYRVALNTAVTWQRSTTKRSSRESLAEPQVERRSRGGHPSPRSQKQILSEFLDLLKGPDRWILLLYMEGLTQQEIAEITGQSESAVGVHIHRMKKVFTERYLEQ